MTTANLTEAKIDANAMLIDLHISQWTARKLDRKATKQVAETAGACDNVGSYYKTLVDSATLDKIKKMVTGVRSYHYTVTLPWSDTGPRILPADLYLEYAHTMQDYRLEFERLVNEFLDLYPLAREEARRILGSLFDPDDYPPTETVANKFKFNYDVLPMPTAQDFRVSLAEDEVERLRQEITQRNEAVLANTMREVYDRVLKVTEAFVDRLGKEDTIFRNSLVDNARDLADLLPKFNLTNDPKLTEIAERMAALCKYQPDDLRKDFGARAETHKAAKGIHDDLMAFLGGEFQ